MSARSLLSTSLCTSCGINDGCCNPTCLDDCKNLEDLLDRFEALEEFAADMKSETARWPNGETRKKCIYTFVK